MLAADPAGRAGPENLGKSDASQGFDIAFHKKFFHHDYEHGMTPVGKILTVFSARFFMSDSTHFPSIIVSRTKARFRCLDLAL